MIARRYRRERSGASIHRWIRRPKVHENLEPDSARASDQQMAPTATEGPTGNNGYVELAQLRVWSQVAAQALDDGCSPAEAAAYADWWLTTAGGELDVAWERLRLTIGGEWLTLAARIGRALQRLGGRR